MQRTSPSPDYKMVLKIGQRELTSDQFLMSLIGSSLSVREQIDLKNLVFASSLCVKSTTPSLDSSVSPTPNGLEQEVNKIQSK